MVVYAVSHGDYISLKIEDLFADTYQHVIPYNGQPDETEIWRWVDAVDFIVSTHNSTLAYVDIRHFLESCLTGQALDWALHLEFDSYAEFRQQFLDRWLPACTAQAKRYDLCFQQDASFCSLGAHREFQYTYDLKFESSSSHEYFVQPVCSQFQGYDHSEGSTCVYNNAAMQCISSESSTQLQNLYLDIQSIEPYAGQQDIFALSTWCNGMECVLKRHQACCDSHGVTLKDVLWRSLRGDAQSWMQEQDCSSFSEFKASLLLQFGPTRPQLRYAYENLIYSSSADIRDFLQECEVLALALGYNLDDPRTLDGLLFRLGDHIASQVAFHHPTSYEDTVNITKYVVLGIQPSSCSGVSRLSMSDVAGTTEVISNVGPCAESNMCDNKNSISSMQHQKFDCVRLSVTERTCDAGVQGHAQNTADVAVQAYDDLLQHSDAVVQQLCIEKQQAADCCVSATAQQTSIGDDTPTVAICDAYTLGDAHTGMDAGGIILAEKSPASVLKVCESMPICTTDCFTPYAISTVWSMVAEVMSWYQAHHAFVSELVHHVQWVPCHEASLAYSKDALYQDELAAGG